MAEIQRPLRSTIDGIDVLTILRPNTTRTVMLLHGYGANYEDLSSLAPILDRHQQWNWIFPNGIQSVPMGGYMSGRSWFPLRMAEIEAAVMRGETFDFTTVLPEGMKVAEARIVSLIETLRISSKDLVLGGFSQGSMMTMQVALNLKEKLKGMILFSGSLINRTEWETKFDRIAEMPFLQSHGRADQILGFQYADRLYQLLSGAKLQGEWVPFNGGHEIPMAVIQKAALFLDMLIKKESA